MTKPTIDFEITGRQSVWVIKPLGPLGPEDEAPLASKLASLVGSGRNRVVVDLSAVPTVDSTTLAVLVYHRQAMLKRGGALLLACPGEHVARVLRTTNLYEILGTCATLEDALRVAGGKGIRVGVEMSPGAARHRGLDFDGEAYRRASSHQRAWGLRLVEELNLQGHEHILDLGSGDGQVTAQLAEQVPSGRVLGIDASPGMLATACKLERPNLRFVQMDINAVAFEAEFDVVFSNAALHWVRDHHRLLTAVHRALRPAGVARFSFAGEGNCATFIRVVRHAMALPEFAGCFSGFQWPWYMPSAHEYRKLAGSVAFDTLSVWEENADRVFPDEQGLIGWLDQPSLVPFMKHLPHNVRAPFRTAIVEAMLRETKVESGGYLETFRRLNFMARKRA